jgi:hypothetical protein
MVQFSYVSCFSESARLKFVGTLIATPAVSAAAASASESSQLLSVHFTAIGTPPFSGIEPVAAAADPVFGQANVWNQLGFVDFGPDVNPSFTSLVDSEGNATSAGFSITGTVGGYGAYLFFNSRELSTSIDWGITGLAPSTSYRLYTYGAAADYIRDCSLLVDTNGNGDLSDESAQLIGSAANDYTASKDAYFPSVLTDAIGSILGRTTAIGDPEIPNEANWGGFQLGVIPEPSSLSLGAVCVNGLIACVRRRSDPQTDHIICRIIVGLAIGGQLLVPASALNAAAVRIVALSGQQAPSLAGGVNFANFNTKSPVLNDTGRTAFMVLLSWISASTPLMIRRSD